jgi:uncharacterized small protein (DUF1192 family)
LFYSSYDEENEADNELDINGASIMDTDDLEPVVKKVEIIDLEVMSIEALGEYIEELQAEIKRVEVEIELKKKARLGAEDVFKK